MRAKLLDRWTREFLALHADATVLHLGCGLDSRVQRIDPGPGVRWFDVDQPQVIELREQVYPARSGYRTIAASVTDPAWLAEVPCDQPVLVVAEGLTMYLSAREGLLLLRRLAGHFPRGEMAFDAFSRWGVRLMSLSPALRSTGCTLDWGIEDARDLEREVPGLRLLSTVSALDMAEPADLAHAERGFRWRQTAFGKLPVVRRMVHVDRYSFG